MGHGHVLPNEDGSKARCGGPGFCPVCNKELVQKFRMTSTLPPWKALTDVCLLSIIRKFLLEAGHGALDMRKEENLLSLVRTVVETPAAHPPSDETREKAEKWDAYQARKSTLRAAGFGTRPLRNDHVCDHVYGVAVHEEELYFLRETAIESEKARLAENYKTWAAGKYALEVVKVYRRNWLPLQHLLEYYTLFRYCPCCGVALPVLSGASVYDPPIEGAAGIGVSSEQRP